MMTLHFQILDCDFLEKTMNNIGRLLVGFIFLLSSACNLIYDKPTSSPAIPPPELNNEVDETGFYLVQDGTPAYIPNFVRPDYGCDWTGIAGQVFDLEGIPKVNLVVEIQGSLSGEPVLFLTLTGDSPEVGPGGYILTFTDDLVASEGTMTIQTLDLNGNALSPRIQFDTLANCDQNLVIVNFVEIPSNQKNYFPFIRNE
jgi:hypothetical protein